ncbi:uncharacterized protein LOC126899425 [Daktulosphaira vitifoliae]|uniref:uncharacterized protein LOC126899425 n=1 Tax=Daktulosphaira vitifoliae TaxID=58002 RepID=UPI0021AA60E0|nr:uncharacterized protein LOC126899425 [Daktulosphaira vitifoliae]
MASSKIVSKCLLLFCVILCIESYRNSKETTVIVDNLLKCVGWKNLGYVGKVTYKARNYYLSIIIKKKITTNNCNTKIRIATIFLGCTYACILKDIVKSINYLRIICSKIIHNELYKSQGRTYIIQLLEIISNVPLFAKKMQGALFAIDELHNIQWKLNNRNTFILKSVFNVLKYLENRVNDYFTLSENYEDDKMLLYRIKMNINLIDQEITKEIGRFKISEPEQKIAQKLNEEFNKYKEERIVEFYHFGTNFVIREINSMMEKYFTKLGFEINSETGITFIPDSLDHLFQDE